jgi:metal-dependent hydrolase (beta-lactamase superfamily II)
MCEWEHQYCNYKGLEFIMHYDGETLLFDTDYKGELFLLELEDGFEVVE